MLPNASATTPTSNAATLTAYSYCWPLVLPPLVLLPVPQHLHPTFACTWLGHIGVALRNPLFNRFIKVVKVHRGSRCSLSSRKSGQAKSWQTLSKLLQPRSAARCLRSGNFTEDGGLGVRFTTGFWIFPVDTMGRFSQCCTKPEVR